MATDSILITAGLLALVCCVQQAAHRFASSRERLDGAPSRQLVFCSACVDIVAVACFVLLARLAPHGIAVFGRLWRHDVWSALLWGGLAGSFLHLVGSGSPLPIASVRSPLTDSDGRVSDAVGLGTLGVFLAGELAASLVWFGFGLPTLAGSLARLPAMAAIAIGYGLRREAAGQDHVLLGAIDGLLLSVLYFLTGSLVAVVVARFLADVLAYVTAVTKADEHGFKAESRI